MTKINARLVATLTNRDRITITTQDDARPSVRKDNDFVPAYLNNSNSDYITINGVSMSGGKPVVQGSSLRGALRNLIALEFIDDVLASEGSNGSFDYIDLVLNASGGVQSSKANGDKKKKDDDDADTASNGKPLALLARRQINPVLDIFGACQPGFIGGALRVSDLRLTPESQSTLRDHKLDIVSVVRADPLERNVGLLERVTGIDGKERNEEFVSKRGQITKEYKTLITKDKTRKVELEAERDAKIVALSADTGATEDVSVKQIHGGGFVDLQLAFPAEMEFDHNMRVINAEPAAFGLLVRGLNRYLAAGATIGGRVAAGYGGHMEGAYEIQLWDDGEGQWRSVDANGTAYGKIDGSSLDGLGADIKACVTAYEDGLAAGKFDYRLAAV
jgi:hypothetical protein